MRRLLCGLASVLVTVGTATAVTAPASAAPPITWHPCDRGLFCATAHVPLDYDDPHGVQISLALIKQPATDPAHRIGSLFLNPGGPGGSGVDFLREAGRVLFTPQVRARFDLIGFDPRGIEASTPLRCFDTEQQAGNALPPFPYPVNAAQRAKQFASDRTVEKACAQRGNAILDHMSTADVARDLDTLRQDVGDAQLSYYGVSYGSFLGNVYANLFPGRVRSVVIDGVLNPVAWTTGRPSDAQLPFTTRLHSSHGALATLNEFFRLCDAGGSRCALAPNSKTKYYGLYHRLQAHPVSTPGRHITAAGLVSETLGAMYDSSSWPQFAREVEQVRTHPAAAASPAAYARYDNGVEGFPGVGCSDSVNPQTPGSWTRAADQASRQDGLFGPIWTWTSSVCAHWPGQDSDRYLGPFDNYTAHPVLVVGNQFDPATPYEGAQAAAGLLPNSRLLTLHAWGHTSLFRSRCATNDIAQYLLTTKVPPAGTVCQQDHVPFSGRGASAAPLPKSVGFPGAA